jgi:hypothetical protein
MDGVAAPGLYHEDHSGAGVVCVRSDELVLAAKLLYYGVKLLRAVPPIPPA